MPAVIDGRGLLPPEPLELVLTALDSLVEGEELVFLIHCQPLPLFGILTRNGYRWSEIVRADGTHEIRIRLA